jgi:hypothetical protein
MNVPKTANNLSEAFLRVREYLWDGAGDFANVFPTQETGICFAATKAMRAKAITLEQRDMIQSIVQLRLHPHNYVSGYMRKKLNVNPTMREVQMYRHGWLIKLSREFKDKE